MKSFRNVALVIGCVTLLLSQTGCEVLKPALTSTKFSQSAYDNDKAVKTQALAVIDRAKNRAAYSTASAEVDKLMAKVDSSIASEQSRTKSGPTVEQWTKIKGQLSDVFTLWKKGPLSPAYVTGIKGQVSKQFDILIKTEEDKPR
jgi:hypothetical protein